ncbi:MAG: hypothetical protein WD267_02280 [Balneolales bacterium]
MIVSILFIIGIYLLFRFVDEGVGMFDSLRLTIRRIIYKKRQGQQQPDRDNQWKGFVIGLITGIALILLILYYDF